MFRAIGISRGQVQRLAGCMGAICRQSVVPWFTSFNSCTAERVSRGIARDQLPRWHTGPPCHRISANPAARTDFNRQD